MNGRHPGDDRLIACVLDELGDHERDTVETHVRDCAACRRVLRRLSGAVDAYRETRDAGAPAGVLIDLLEAQAVARIQSEHVVEVVDVVQTRGGLPCLVAELLEGEDLASILERAGKIPVSSAITVCSMAIGYSART